MSFEYLRGNISSFQRTSLSLRVHFLYYFVKGNWMIPFKWQKVITWDFQVPKTELAHVKHCCYDNQEQIFLLIMAQKIVFVFENTFSFKIVFIHWQFIAFHIN